jgi:hypothetical protein
MNLFEEYNNQFENDIRIICFELCKKFNVSLNSEESKLYHGTPVWFINKNPIVGYSKKTSGIAVLFWSGQSFKNPGLKAIGKFKAAEKIYTKIEDLNMKEIEQWLEESKAIIWDYKNIRNNNGNLNRI